MRDLDLWELLEAGEPAPDRLLPLLETLPDLPLPDRIAFLPHLVSLLKHERHDVRRAAARALRGAEGVPALEALVAALEDSRPETLPELLETFRQAVASDPLRWCHALFHPRDEVRLLAAALDPPAGAELLRIHLLADPLVRESLAGRLPDPPLRTDQIACLLDLASAGVYEPERVREWISLFARRHPRALLEWLGTVVPEPRRESLDDLDPATLPAPPPGDGTVGRLLDLFWDESPGRTCTAAPHPFFGPLGQALCGVKAPARAPIVAAICGHAAARGSFLAPAAELCARVHPPFLGYPWIDRRVRRGALEAVALRDTGIPRHPPEVVAGLARGDLVQDERGLLDAGAVAGILRYLKEAPIQTALDWFGSEELLAAIERDPCRGLAMLALDDRSRRGRGHLVGLLRGSRVSPPLLEAALALHLPADEARGLGVFAPRRCAGIVVELHRLLAQRGGRVEPSWLDGVMPLLAGALDERGSRSFLDWWARADAPREWEVGRRLVGQIARLRGAGPLEAVTRKLPDDRLVILLERVDECSTIPFDVEVQLARKLASHADDRVRAWAHERLQAARPRAPGLPPQDVPDFLDLGPSHIDRLASCDEDRIDTTQPVTRWVPLRGLAEALARRRRPARPRVETCAALVGSVDPLDAVDAQLVRFGSDSASFAGRLEESVVLHFGPLRTLPLQAHAWLSNWESHLFAFERAALAWPGGLEGFLRASLGFASGLLLSRLWRAARQLLAVRAYRDPARYDELFTEGLGRLLVDGLKGHAGTQAARALADAVRVRRALPILERLRPAVVELAPDLPADTRAILGQWIDSTGLPAADPARDGGEAAPAAELLAMIAGSTDPAELARVCATGAAGAAAAAAARLVELGAAGEAWLIRVLRTEADPPGLEGIVRSVPRLAERTTLDAARELVADGALSPRTRFVLGLALAGRQEKGLEPHLLDAASRPCASLWFSCRHWARLLELGLPEEALCEALVTSPHPRAYGPAVQGVLARPHGGRTPVPALVRFLRCGSDRSRQLRYEAAARLAIEGEWGAFPMIVAASLRRLREDRSRPEPAASLLKGVSTAHARLLTMAALLAGPAAFPERLVLAVLLQSHENDPSVEESLGTLLTHAQDGAVRQAVVNRLYSTRSRREIARRLARALARGVIWGRELTGRLLAIKLLSGDELGYTRIGEDSIHVNVVPLLDGEPHAGSIVEGLMLHEIGHQMYHAGARGMEIWEKAREEGLAWLLNLVADEHLERKLRALSPGFGDRFKRLAAHAFQHRSRDVPVPVLLRAFGARSFAVLSATPLKVARTRECVRLRSGRVLARAEAQGLRFTRFVRALRLGLGKRSSDPLVAQALDLFDHRFKDLPHAGLLPVARRLREIFGIETALVEAFSPEAADPAERSRLERLGRGVTNEELAEEVERIVNPRKRESRAPVGRTILQLNVTPDERFDRIGTVVPLTYDPAEHRKLARRVSRHARLLGRYLDRLGIDVEPVPRRSRGHSVERSRLLASVIRRDPRILRSRIRLPRNDLFLAVLIDCSQSMAASDRLDRARLFGALIAEAVRPLRGVDLRLFGFSDHEIFDAGDARRPALHGLRAGGGNNDAAALWHAAAESFASRRSSRVLVMVSDGLPTECSVAALRALVSRLSRMPRTCCAQVAVRPLEEICFPHHVVLAQDNLDLAVIQFGRIVGRLVRTTLRGPP